MFVVLLVIAPSSQELGPPTNPARFKARLRSHRTETEQQISRVEQILADLGESHSNLKDLGLSISGNLAALSHTVAGDEIIKNSFANFAFENFEIASYTGLITLAEDGGFGSVTALLEQSLAEEQSMASFVIGGIPKVMRTFVDLRAAGEDASH